MRVWDSEFLVEGVGCLECGSRLWGVAGKESECRNGFWACIAWSLTLVLARSSFFWDSEKVLQSLQFLLRF